MTSLFVRLTRLPFPTACRLRSQEEIDAMTNAIRAGWIQWHGNALNNFIELQDAGLFK
jgi:hypothetical protein